MKVVVHNLRAGNLALPPAVGNLDGVTLQPGPNQIDGDYLLACLAMQMPAIWLREGWISVGAGLVEIPPGFFEAGHIPSVEELTALGFPAADIDRLIANAKKAAAEYRDSLRGKQPADAIEPPPPSLAVLVGVDHDGLPPIVEAAEAAGDIEVEEEAEESPGIGERLKNALTGHKPRARNK